MDWKSLLFSFRGRVNRAKYWLAILIVVIVNIILEGIRVVAEQGTDDSLAGILTLLAVGVVVLAVALTFAVAGLAVATKRLHDRDKSAWWLLVFYLLPSVLAGVGAGVTLATDSWLAFGLFGAVSSAIGIWAFIDGLPARHRWIQSIRTGPAPFIAAAAAVRASSRCLLGLAVPGGLTDAAHCPIFWL